jgi:recombination protein RecT
MNTQITTRDERPPIVVLKDRLEQRKAELKAALADIPPEQFIRAVITSATINPDIQACSWHSVWLACMRACRDGLLPDGVEGAIVPFKSNAQWIPMYQGLLRRFRRSGQFKWVTAGIVRKGEMFEHWIDHHGEHFKHVPGDDINAPIERIYALATTKDDGVFVTVIPIAEANKMRNMSRSTRDDAPWKQWPEEMYRKTALRRLCKMLPSTRDLIAEDDEIEAPPTTLPTTGGLRPASIGERLEHFAKPEETTKNGPPEVATPASDHGSDGQAETLAPDARAPEPEPAVADRDYIKELSEAAGYETTELAAYQAGKEARAAGIRKSACPGEYRESAKLNAAWLAGWNRELFA